MIFSVNLLSILIRLSIFSLLWLLLVDGAMNSWVIGVPIVILATFVSIKLLPRTNLSLIALFKFVPFFLWNSLLGGFDVAKRVFYLKVAISPTVICYPCRLPDGFARVFMAQIISLLPGTLVVDLDGDFLHIHLLDEGIDFNKELVLLEKKVAEIFKINLLIVEKQIYG